MKNKNGWHVLYVGSKQEGKVYRSLIESGLDSFLPMTTVIRKWSDRVKKLSVPLFASYVFVNIKSKMDFHKINNIKGVSAFIKFGSNYAIVRDEEIERIKFLVESEDIKDIEIKHELPKIGELMKISQGALSNLECEILKVNNINKIIVRIGSLKQSLVATIPSSYLNYSYLNITINETYIFTISKSSLTLLTINCLWAGL